MGNVLFLVIVFTLLGSIQAVYGPLIPIYQDTLGSSAVSGSYLLSFHFTGAILGIFLARLLMRKYIIKTSMLMGITIVIIGCILSGISSSMLQTYAGAFIIGVGFGLTDTGLFAYAGLLYKDKSPGLLNLLASLFGIGSMIGPVILSFFINKYSYVYLLFVILASVSIFFMKNFMKSDKLDLPPIMLPNNESFPLLALMLFYSTLEIVISTYVVDFYKDTMGLSSALQIVAAYWLALTVGRIFFAFTLSKMKPGLIILIVPFLIVSSITYHAFNIQTYWVFGVIGFLMAPLFPTTIGLVASRYGEASVNIIPAILIITSAAPILIAPLSGLAIAKGGGATFTFLIFIVSIGLLVSSLISHKTSKSPSAL